jgi:hypothetical protein
MRHDSAGRRRKCHLRIDQRPHLLHRKTSADNFTSVRNYQKFHLLHAARERDN